MKPLSAKAVRRSLTVGGAIGGAASTGLALGVPLLIASRLARKRQDKNKK